MCPQSNEVRRAKYAENPEKYRARNRRLRKLYPERYRDYEHRKLKKKGRFPEPTRPCPEKCETCGRPSVNNRALSLDHDHATGKFRGWLCQKCNAVLGFVDDSEDILINLRDYLIRSRQ